MTMDPARAIDVIEDLLKQMNLEGCIMTTEEVLTAQMFITIMKYQESKKVKP